MSDIISGLDARMVLDSRGNPTVEVDCYVDGGLLGRAMVPSGASTGAYEAIELRDGDASRWLGKGVDDAVNNVVESIQEALVGMPVDDQKAIDEIMIELDGTPNKANLGANAMLGVSMACLHAGAALHELPLWRYVGGVAGGLMPVPMLNILNGGAHAASNVDIQEFMVMPHGFDTFPEALRAGVECYHALKKELKADGLLGGVGDEGGFAPNLPANEAGLGYMVRAIEGAGYSTEEIGIALDVASTEFYKDDAYHMDGSVYNNFPISYEFSFTSTPLIIDLDQDGDLELIAGSAGALVSVDVMEGGSIDGYWSQDRSDNQKRGYYELVESECSSPLLGDINCDSLLDVLDILMVVNTIINESSTTEYQGWASDLNQDGIIDILDILIIVDLIIN